MDEEVKKELEQATEIDIEHLFTELFKPTEALQKIVCSALERLDRDGVDTKGFYLTIEKDQLTIHLGKYSLYHEIRHNIYKVM